VKRWRSGIGRELNEKVEKEDIKKRGRKEDYNERNKGLFLMRWVCKR
jgi:hypothetical protein